MFFTKSVGPSVSLEILQAQMFYRKKCRNNDFLYKVCSTKCFYENVARTNVFLKCRNQCFYTKPVGPSVSMTNLQAQVFLYKVCRTKCFYEKTGGTSVFIEKTVVSNVSIGTIVIKKQEQVFFIKNNCRNKCFDKKQSVGTDIFVQSLQDQVFL